MILSNASLARKGLRGETRFLTNTNTTTYANADLDAALNAYYDLFTTEILDAMDEWDFQGEIAVGDLVASQQEYIFPSDILKIKRIEISYDGTTWKEANPMDINERSGASDATSVNNDFSTSQPFYDLMDGSVFLFPIPTAAVTGGIKIWYEKLVTQLSADTDEPVILRPFHKGLCYGASKDYFEKYSEQQGFTIKLNNANQNLENYISRMKATYRKRNQDRAYNLECAYQNFDYGNE